MGACVCVSVCVCVPTHKRILICPSPGRLAARRGRRPLRISLRANFFLVFLCSPPFLRRLFRGAARQHGRGQARRGLQIGACIAWQMYLPSVCIGGMWEGCVCEAYCQQMHFSSRTFRNAFCFCAHRWTVCVCV